MSAQKHSLDQQIEELAQAIDYIKQIEGRFAKKSVIEFRQSRLRAAKRTLEWIKANEGDIRSYIEARKQQVKIEDAA